MGSFFGHGFDGFTWILEWGPIQTRGPTDLITLDTGWELGAAV